MTTNHQAHGPVSLDRLYQIREILSKAAKQSDGGNLGYAMADAVKAIDELLSVRKTAAQEAVYQVLDDGSWTDYSKQQLEVLLESKPSTLFRVAYPSPSLTHPVSVDEDDNFYSWFGREWHENYQHCQHTTAAKQMLGVMAESAWKSGRRAAMLQAGNSPVSPDTWIPVSERMPDKLIPVMVMYEDGEMWSAMWNGNSWDDGTEYPDPHEVTHWREMPAAPQQE